MNNLKKLRTSNSLTVRELSEKVNINYATLSRLENEESHFNNDYIKKISSFFGVTSDYLLGLTDSPNQQQRIKNAIQAEKIPVYSLIFGGENKLRKEYLIDEEFAPATEDLKGCTYMLASEDFKTEGIFKGDLLLVKLTSVKEAGLVVVAKNNEPGVVRNLVELNKQWVLIADNNIPSSMDGYEVLGQVLIVSRRIIKVK